MSYSKRKYKIHVISGIIIAILGIFLIVNSINGSESLIHNISDDFNTVIDLPATEYEFPNPPIPNISDTNGLNLNTVILEKVKYSIILIVEAEFRQDFRWPQLRTLFLFFNISPNENISNIFATAYQSSLLRYFLPISPSCYSYYF